MAAGQKRRRSLPHGLREVQGGRPAPADRGGQGTVEQGQTGHSRRVHLPAGHGHREHGREGAGRGT